MVPFTVLTYSNLVKAFHFSQPTTTSISTVLVNPSSTWPLFLSLLWSLSDHYNICNTACILFHAGPARIYSRNIVSKTYAYRLPFFKAFHDPQPAFSTITDRSMIPDKKTAHKMKGIVCRGNRRFALAFLICFSVMKLVISSSNRIDEESSSPSLAKHPRIFPSTTTI